MIGKTATVTTTVSERNTAMAVGSGSLNVFSTPMMIALMEQAACECLTLEPGQTSVGTQINVAHTAASPLGAAISATAVIDKVDGRKVSFTLTAHEGENEIGNGKHDRFIVDAERFMSKLLPER